MYNNKFAHLLATFSCLLSASFMMPFAEAESFYVSPAGDDSAAGSETAPWATIQKAADTVPEGSTVYLREGIYNEKVLIQRGGTSESTRITFTNYPDETPIIDGTGIVGGQYSGLVLVVDAGYITLEGMEVRNNSIAHGVRAAGSITHLIFNKLRVHDNAKSGIVVNQRDPEQRNYTYIRNCVVFRNEWAGIHVDWGLGGYFVIEGNTVYENRGTGNYDAIETGVGDTGSGVHHVVVRNNNIYDNNPDDFEGVDAIDLGGRNDTMSHWLVENNVVSGPSRQHVKFSQPVDYGIMRRNVLNSSGFIDLYAPPYTRSCIYQNTLFETIHGIQFSVSGRPQDLNWGGIQFRNNVFALTQSYSILSIYGDILDRSFESMFFDGDLFLFSEEFSEENVRNLTDNWQEVGQEPHALITEVTAAELFRDPDAGDFRLPEASPAVDAGLPLTVTASTGTGNVIPVYEAFYFHDDWDGLIEADEIQVGGNSRVRIVSIDLDTNLIEVDRDLTWSEGDPVSLPWSGAAPDVGALERESPEIMDSIIVTSPNGGETYALGATLPITWTMAGTTGTEVEILGHGAGRTFTLAATTPNDGAYDWVIPQGQALATDYTIEVRSLAYPTIFDSSNASFTIGGTPPADSITILTPNGGESFARGETTEITWTSTGNVGANVKIKARKGTSSANITNSTPNDGSFTWQVPNGFPLGTGMYIEIASTTNPSILDICDGTFTITSTPVTPTITVTTPNGGETYALGATVSIIWTTAGTTGSEVEILAHGAGQTFTLAATTPNDGAFDWVVPQGQPLATDYTIEVRSLAYPTIFDSSNASFTIGGTPPADSITILTPNGGESFARGETTEITWTSTGNVGANVKITARKGTSSGVITNSTPNDGSYTWTVPASYPHGPGMYIEIASTTNPSILDICDGTFTITP